MYNDIFLVTLDIPLVDISRPERQAEIDKYLEDKWTPLDENSDEYGDGDRDEEYNEACENIREFFTEYRKSFETCKEGGQECRDGFDCCEQGFAVLHHGRLIGSLIVNSVAEFRNDVLDIAYYKQWFPDHEYTIQDVWDMLERWYKEDYPKCAIEIAITTQEVREVLCSVMKDYHDQHEDNCFGVSEEVTDEVLEEAISIIQRELNLANRKDKLLDDIDRILGENITEL